MKNRDSKRLEQAYLVVLKEFFDVDGGVEDDSWWWEERPKSNHTLPSQAEPNYKTSKDQNDGFSVVRSNNNYKNDFNCYEQCNKLILSCETKSEIIQHFCRILSKITETDKNAQAGLIEYVNQISNLSEKESVN